MSIRFTDQQVKLIINKWKEDIINNSVSSNAANLCNMKQKFNKEFGTNVTEFRLQAKIKYLKKI